MTAVLPPSSPPLEETWKQVSKVVVPFQPSGEGIEVRLRHAAKDKRLRFAEFFKDFDPLRSGFISRERFRLCLNEHLGLTISDEDFAFLVQKYGQEKSGMINYKGFEEAMEKFFEPSMLSVHPEKQIDEFKRSTEPVLPQTLDEDDRLRTEYLLWKCHDYYQTRGISLKSCYCDFDRHHRGYVTQTQFHRSFPGPTDVSATDICLLAQRYYNASNGLYNYLQFHDDVVNACPVEERRDGPPLPPAPGVPAPPTIEEILGRIRDVVYKKGIRTTEFFCDYDKLRSGAVPENKFLSGLSLCCGTVAGLSSEELQRIADYYRRPDGKIRYTEFCHIMENAYNEPYLEKKPLVEVQRPLRGHITKPLVPLPVARDAQRLEEILEYLRDEVKTRRILLHPYFRDFDKGKGFTKGVTKPQFERILYFLNLNLSTEDMRILATRFAANNGVDVNYIDFIQSVDPLYVGQIMEGEKVPVKTAPTVAAVVPIATSQVQMLISRLREHINRKRLRPTDYFSDADPLRCGSITIFRFRQGISSMGKPDLTEAEFKGLCHAYSDPKLKNHILWKKFVSALEDPIIESPVSIPIPLPLPELPQGAVDFSKEASDEDMKCLQGVLYRLSEKVKQRRMEVEPLFVDFDRNYIGYITRSQFRQCLASLHLEATPTESAVMEQAFGDNRGFNYRKFLRELIPKPTWDKVYDTRMARMELTKKTSSLSLSRELPVSVVEVLDKVKAKVCRERIRVEEFLKDYDKLRCGAVNLNIFSRAMDLCGFELSGEELRAIQLSFPSSKLPNGVDYATFCDEIESIFTTKGLEKNPTGELELFVPPPPTRPFEFAQEENEILDTALHRIADKVRQHRMQLFPLFQDYDRVNIGSVSQGQFHRVLTELQLADFMSDLELQLVYRKYLVLMGNRKDVNYIAFCHKCNEYAQNIWP